MSSERSASAYRVAHTKYEGMAQSILTSMKIPYLSSVKVVRPNSARCYRCSKNYKREELEKEQDFGFLHCPKCGELLFPIYYEVDIQIFPPRKIGLEIWGTGTSSFNRERQEFLKSQGWKVYYIPNEVVQKYPEVFEQFVALLEGSP